MSEDCALETRNEIFAHLPARPSLDALYPDVSRLATFFHAASRLLPLTSYLLPVTSYFFL